MAEGGKVELRATNSPECQDRPLTDPGILKTKRVVLVETLEELESVLVGLKPFLQRSELHAIDAEANHGAKIGKMIDYLQRRVAGKSYFAYNTFMKMVAGVQPELFVKLADRSPTRSEVDFCVQNYVKTTKEKIQASGHLTDSVLDQKIDLDTEHVELAIVRDKQNSEMSDPIPHRYQSQLSDIESKQENIPVLEVLGMEERKREPKRVSLQGRAGTGKTTTMQLLARQWSLNKWAAEFTMIFLIQLRMLSLSDFPMTAIELLTAYSLYRVAEDDLITIGSSWIKASTSKFLLFIDGLDEIGGFTSRLKNCQKITGLNIKAHPINICLNIIRGDLLPGCTVVCASRPFTGLSAIRFDKKLEILGLTEARIWEFAKKKHPCRSGHIISVLKNSPLLRSVCSITFYCSLVSQLLADGVVFRNEDLQTYTRLIAFLMVHCVSRRLSEFPFILEVGPYFPKLASMAHHGTFERHLSGDISKLVFDEYDMAQSLLSPQDLRSLQNFGVLQTKSIRNHLRSSVIAEFLHFSLQELLASAYLLLHFPRPDDIFRKLFSGGQFNMALLYVFGLQYDIQCSWVKDIRFAVHPSNKGLNQLADMQINDFLEYLCQECKGQSKGKLQICQLVHESQMESKAEAVVKYVAPSGALVIEGTSMTMIDLMSVRFVCKYASSISKVSMANCSLTDTLLRFLVSSLMNDHCKTLHELDLVGNKIAADGAQAIGEWLKQNQTLQTLNVGGNNIGVDGSQPLADALLQSSTLQTLKVNGNNIGDNGTKVLAFALKQNTTLHTFHVNGNKIGIDGASALAKMLEQNSILRTLNIHENNIGEDGANALAKSLQQNNSLRILNIHENNIGEDGAKALAKMLCHNSTLQVLNLWGNNIGENGAKALGKALCQNKTLQTLDVSDNSIGENGAKAFSDGLSCNDSLITLHVHSNDIGDCGAVAFADALRQNSRLQTLGVWNNRIGDIGAKGLADSLHHNMTLQVLDVQKNSIFDRGIKAFAMALCHNKTLQTLGVWGNYMGEAGATALAEAKKHNKTIRLEM